MNKYTCYLSLKLVLVTIIVGVSLPSQADDTEIYFSEKLANTRPNVLFVVDSSGSMDLNLGGDSRLDVMKRSLSSVLKTAPDSINVGLMNFGEIMGHSGGHGVKFPVSPITDEALPIVMSKFDSSQWWRSSIPEPSSPTITVRDYLSEITHWYWKDNWYEDKYKGKDYVGMRRVGATPLVDAMYEAGQYFQGGKVTFGLGTASYKNRWSAHPSTYDQGVIESVCEETTLYQQQNAIDFDNEEYPWITCANSDNTSVSYDHCKATESCKVENKGAWKWVAYTTRRGKTRYGWRWVYEDITECSYELCSITRPNLTTHNYVTPITQECQSNYIVLLSDGEPTSYIDTDLDADYNETYKGMRDGTHPALIDKSNASNVFTHSDCNTDPWPNGFHDGVCGPDITQFLSEADSSDLPGVQTIKTYTIGLGLQGSAEAYLKNLVTTDDPATPEVEGYFSVNNEKQIVDAFNDILTEISTTTTSFASPGYAVNTRTGLENEDVIYIPVFDKHLTPRWSGNLKKFALRKDADGSNSTIVGKNGEVAVTELGVFKEDAIDLYSTSITADGSDITKGGLANLINPNTRKVWSNIACTSGSCGLSNDNLLLPDNSTLLNLDLGLSSADFETDQLFQEKQKDLINFIRGRTKTETGTYELHPRMGDMLHSVPAIVTYDKDYRSGSLDEDYNKQVIFVGTNEGYLHAFDTVSGKELFAFMPASLLKNINVQYQNTDIGNHAYGIDGNITSWVNDGGDGVVDADNGDHVYLYFGLRRGGREYYALDVTDPENPKLLWKLDSNTEKFGNLGQSWSTPKVVKVQTSSSADIRDVVVFSGGYDENQDIEDRGQRASQDSMGNDVFIVDAKTGAYIWSLQGGSSGSSADLSNATQLTHSIPGDARLLDMNQDHVIDRMYFADTGGVVWRLELPMGADYDMGDARLIKFADLSGQGEDARMFYNEPDVALLQDKGKNWLTVSIGSGYRSHPADRTVSDKFFVMLDAAVNVPLTTNLAGDDAFKTIDMAADLVEVTISGNTINQPEEMKDKTIFGVENNKSGWYLTLPGEGEKVLSTSITSNGNVMFTSLVLEAGDVGVCEVPITQGRMYSLNILTAEPGDDLNKDGSVTDTDAFIQVSANEIPGTPQLVFNSPYCADGKCKHLIDIRVGKKNSATTSYDSAYLESVFWNNPTN